MNTDMKNSILKITIIVCLSLFSGLSAYGQTESIVFSPMNKLGELPGYVDVYVEIHRCPDKDYNEVIVKIQNESNSDKVAHFYLDVMNNNNADRFSKEFSIPTTSGDWILTDCDSSDELKFKLPSSYNPNGTSVYLRWDM